MIKRRLKFRYILLLVGALFIIPLLTISSVVRTNMEDNYDEEVDYVTEDTIHNYIPVMNTTTVVMNPYTDSEVTISKNYYDFKADEDSQIKSIVQKENIYLQNTGIDYISKNPFDIVSILDGTVMNIMEDESYGKTIEIKHQDGLISSYQNLSEIKVKKGDIIVQGQIIGRSGTNENEENILHFEMYNNGQSINPENYLNKELKTEKGN